MTRKRKKGKSSPGDANFQTPVKRRESKPVQTMAEALAEAIAPSGENMQPMHYTGQGMYQSSPNYVLHQSMPYNGNTVWSPGPGNATPVSIGTSPQNVNNDLWVKVMNKLNIMDKKLAQLDSIQSSVNNLTVRMDSIDHKISDIEGKIRDIKIRRVFDSKTVPDLAKQHQDLESLVKKLTKFEQEQSQKENSLNNEIQDLKCRSMRDNLLSHKIPEERDENCEHKVLKLIEEKLKVTNASTDIRIQRAHRIGAFNAVKTRPIVVKFAFYPDRERVRQAARQVKDDSIGVSEQFPREIMDKRRKLVPIMLKAREDGKEAYIRVDKLYINKRLYRDSE
ncbi:uncharacterized protein LOC128204704 [Mya arenaria]|uniref:uncharacterized protein LOC128204704 n=1 Tax=Mya arenaria TaxID=6604 RepID=UPI0022E151DD|nr:uncharacterized protein LOC128204704 [Mya arenaria]